MKKLAITALITLLTLSIFVGCGQKEEPKSPRDQLLKNRDSSILKDKIKDLGIAIPIGFKVESSCEAKDFIADNYELSFEAAAENYKIMVVRMPIEAADELRTNSCVIEIIKLTDLKGMIDELEVEFANDRVKKFAQSNIAKAIKARDVTDRNEITQLLDDKRDERIEGGEEFDIISSYQLYVTPEAKEVQDLAKTLKSPQDLLNFVTNKVAWIADTESASSLKKAGVKIKSNSEHWLNPAEILTITDKIEPELGLYKDDCSGQANLLASTLIAQGYNPNNVRVVLALVDFGDGQEGGHAFVQVYDPKYQVWYAIDPTMGTYIEDGKLYEGIDSIEFDYFLSHEYEVTEMWLAYNNKYFHDFEKPKDSNAPQHWLAPNAQLDNVLNQELNQ